MSLEGSDWRHARRWDREGKRTGGMAMGMGLGNEEDEKTWMGS